MNRLAILLALVPLVALAQTTSSKPAASPQTTKPPVSTPKPAAPATTAPAAAARKTVPAATPAATSVARMTDDQKTIYALGLAVQRSLGQFDLSAAEVEILKRAVGDAAIG